MKRELTIEALVGTDTGVLVEVAQVLRAMELLPESLVWSAISHTYEARLWMIVAIDDSKLRELVADLGKIPGVSRVIIHGPGQAILEKLAGPLTTP
jgi:acetolactate synthase small subunit